MNGKRRATVAGREARKPGRAAPNKLARPRRVDGGINRRPGRLMGKEIAWVFGCTAQAVTNWSRAGCPRNGDGTYDLRKVIRWNLKRREDALQAEKRRRDEEPGSGRTSVELERSRKHRANILAMQERQMRGELIDVEDVKGQAARAAELFRTRLLALPATLSRHLEGLLAPDISDRLDGQLREVLGALDEDLGELVKA